ncbi:MAG: aldo/keto reductase [Proteobacteria bacterium]|nr:aldo/keto reductase [Pseudomonadota bacterium]MBU1581952.1 aldo/keto reductase [Pseudomonadota bacterium]MBU2453802.1 aldo/keto reductase [Pseudomonadota bacterium]MBU2627366.1 aldo/keto reductase [Pseudomonadota bacterium]
MTNELVPQIKTISSSVFQQTGKKLTVIGLGGEGVLRTTGMKDQAREVITTAVAQGITYYDSARVYMDSELYYGTYWNKNPEKREMIFHTSKSARRSKQGALDDLTQTLARLKTSYLDLWQIHDVRDENDLHLISKSGGALEAFIEAREKGLVKHIGVTGHHDPQILTRAVEQWPVDSVLMPVNPVEEIIGGFLTQTLSAAHKKGIAVIGMKVLGQKHYIAPEMGITAELLIRFALSHDITLAIVGCSSANEVSALVKAGKADQKLSLDERREIMKPYRQMAQKLAYYRGSVFNVD